MPRREKIDRYEYNLLRELSGEELCYFREEPLTKNCRFLCRNDVEQVYFAYVNRQQKFSEMKIGEVAEYLAMDVEHLIHCCEWLYWMGYFWARIPFGSCYFVNEKHMLPGPGEDWGPFKAITVYKPLKWKHDLQQTPEWKEARDRVIKEKCEECGSTKNLCVHHTQNETTPVEYLAMENVQTLCSRCHYRKHAFMLRH